MNLGGTEGIERWSKGEGESERVIFNRLMRVTGMNLPWVMVNSQLKMNDSDNKLEGANKHPILCGKQREEANMFWGKDKHADTFSFSHNGSYVHCLILSLIKLIGPEYHLLNKCISISIGCY